MIYFAAVLVDGVLVAIASGPTPELAEVAAMVEWRRVRDDADSVGG